MNQETKAALQNIASKAIAELTVTDAANFQVQFLGSASPAFFHQITDGTWIEYEVSKKRGTVTVEQKSDEPERIDVIGGWLGFRITNRVACNSFEIAERDYDLLTFPTAIDVLQNRIRKRRF